MSTHKFFVCTDVDADTSLINDFSTPFNINVALFCSIGKNSIVFYHGISHLFQKTSDIFYGAYAN